MSEPTKGLRVHAHVTADGGSSVSSTAEYKYAFDQAQMDSEYINCLIIADESRSAQLAHTAAYVVIQDDPPCSSCHKPETYTIQGPDECASGITYQDLSDAEESALALNEAYASGLKAAPLVPNWIEFDYANPSSFPKHLSRILVWDTDLNDVFCCHWYYWMSDPEKQTHWKNLKYTHWMYAPIKPNGVAQTVQSAAEPTEIPPIEPTPFAVGEELGSTIDWDDIPF